MPFRDLITVADDQLHATFVAILHRTYGGEDWQTVEPFARQAWSPVAWREPRPWTAARDMLRQEWERARHESDKATC